MSSQTTERRAPVPGTDIAALARTEFLALGDRAYLDAACIGIAPRRAVSAVNAVARRAERCAEESGTAHHVALKREHTHARAAAARLIGASESDVALVESATHGLAIAARALPLEPGDEVAVCDLEFVQAAVAFGHLRQRSVKVRRIPHKAGTLPLDTVREHLTPGVRALCVSSVQWTNGYRADLAGLAQLCHAHGVFLVVDAAQHLGALPLDVRKTPVDILTCGGHKWLNSPFGLGLLYLSPRVRDRLRLPDSGFFAAEPSGTTWGEAFADPAFSPFLPLDFTRDARAWEIGGTPNVPGAAGLAASLELIERAGIRRIAGHIDALNGRLLEGLDRLGVLVVSPRDPARRSGITTFTIGPGVADQAALRWLSAAGIAVSVRYSAGVGGVRVSCHLFNTADDVDRLLAALADFLDGAELHAAARNRPVETVTGSV